MPFGDYPAAPQRKAAGERGVYTGYTKTPFSRWRWLVMGVMLSAIWFNVIQNG